MRSSAGLWPRSGRGVRCTCYYRYHSGGCPRCTLSATTMVDTPRDETVLPNIGLNGPLKLHSAYAPVILLPFEYFAAPCLLLLRVSSAHCHRDKRPSSCRMAGLKGSMRLCIAVIDSSLVHNVACTIRRTSFPYACPGRLRCLVVYSLFTYLCHLISADMWYSNEWWLQHTEETGVSSPTPPVPNIAHIRSARLAI